MNNSYTHKVTKNKQKIASFTDGSEAREFAHDIKGNVYKIPAIPTR